MSDKATNHRITVHEGSQPQDEVVGGSPQVRRSYKILKEIFKRGRIWEPGEVIELDPTTGAAFEDLGEVDTIETDGESQ